MQNLTVLTAVKSIHALRGRWMRQRSKTLLTFVIRMPKEYKKTSRVKKDKPQKVTKPKVLSSLELKRKARERVSDKKYWIARADKWFSIFIRLFYADKDGYIRCYTCDKRIHWKDAHNCHREERANYYTRWMFDNCRAWCSWCNQYHSERHKRIMTLKLAKELWLERLEEIHATKRELQRMNILEIKEIALYWEAEAKKLANELWVEIK